MAWIGQLAGCGSVILIMVPFFNLTFGASWLFIFVARDLNTISGEVLAVDEIHIDELKTRMCDLIELYTDTKQ